MTAPLIRLLAGLAGLGLATWGYGRYYQWRHGLKPQNERERPFDTAFWEAQADQTHPWLDQAHFGQKMVEQVEPYLARYRQLGVFQCADGQTLAYQIYPHPAAQATLLILPGLNEFKEKFEELAYYWHQEGCQVIALDLRGHGASQPYGPAQAIHSQRFDQYADDVQALVTHLAAQGHLSGPLVVYGHSMGGAVATRFCQRYPQLAQGLVLSSPMLAIDTGNIPFAYAHALSRLVTLCGGGRGYAPRQGAFDPARHQVYPQTNRWSTQVERGQYFHDWHLAHHQPPTWGATWSWLATSLASSRAILHPAAVAQLQLPVLIFRAELDDHVLASGIHALASQLPQAQAYLVPGVKHELYLESDAVVRAYVTCIRQFIANL